MNLRVITISIDRPPEVDETPKSLMESIIKANIKAGVLPEIVGTKVSFIRHYQSEVDQKEYYPEQDEIGDSRLPRPAVFWLEQTDAHPKDFKPTKFDLLIPSYLQKWEPPQNGPENIQENS